MASNNTTALACYLNLPQWKSDAVVHEIACILRDHSDNNEMLLSAVGIVLSARTKSLMASEQCKLKRFVKAATEDFRMGGTNQNPTMSFIGPAARYELPTEKPQDTCEQPKQVDSATNERFPNNTAEAMRRLSSCSTDVEVCRRASLMSMSSESSSISLRSSPANIVRNLLATTDMSKLANLLEQSTPLCYED